MSANVISAGELFERMKDGCEPSTSERPPFTLILGSGFSFPIIPTTSQIVREDLPWWKWCQGRAKGSPSRDDYLKRNTAPFAGGSKEEAKAFWQRVMAAAAGMCNSDKPLFSLDAEGLPDKSSIGEAYRFALSAKCGPGLCTPDQVRSYFGDLVRRIGRRLNPSHLYLAALIAERPRLFGTLFTTNFDPLLQRALQLVNVPYFVSDRPDTMQHPDDDIAEAIHLVYAHGSIYRYLLLNSPEQIEEYANRNQSLLQEYFRKHAVLIVGYSGWDDAITRALLKVEQFAQNLYWCDRGSTLENSGLSDFAKQILQKHANAFYVPIHGADRFMVEMHQHVLGHALPRLFRSPIEAVKSQLRQCDLTGVRVVRDIDLKGLPADTSADGKSGGSARASSGADELNLGEEVNSILKRLDDAHELFTGVRAEAADPRALLASRVRQQLATASDLHFGTNPAAAIPYLDFVIANADVLDAEERSVALFRRGIAYSMRGELGDVDREIVDYTAVVDMVDAPSELRVAARAYRGVAYGRRDQAGDVDRAITDLSAVLEMPDAPTEQRAMARVNRGLAFGQRGHGGDVDREIADYTAVIAMPDVSPEQQAMALINRGISYGQRGEANDMDREIADYTSVIDMPYATAEQRSKAYVNRGVTYGQRGQPGDVDRKVADYTAVIEMPDAPAEQRAKARVNRGVAYGERGQPGDADRAIADFTATIDMRDVSAEQHAMALANRAVTYGQRGQAGDSDRAIADLTATIDMSEASTELRATARVNRGLAYRQRGQAGDVGHEIADYTAVMDMPDAPIEQRAKARASRGVTYAQRGQTDDADRAISDFTGVIELSDVSADLRTTARVNRGLAYRHRQQPEDLNRAIADLTAVIEAPDATDEQRGAALVGRAIAYRHREQPGDLDYAISDFTRIVNLPNAPAGRWATALVSRAEAYRHRDTPGDLNLAISDLTAVLDMPDTTAEMRATARLSRGLVYRHRRHPGDVTRAISDFSALANMREAPLEDQKMAKALLRHLRRKRNSSSAEPTPLQASPARNKRKRQGKV